MFLAMFSMTVSGFSDTGCEVMGSVSILSFPLSTEAESPLCCRLSPNIPSFSTATKVVRTFDRGRGESVGEGDPNDRK